MLKKIDQYPILLITVVYSLVSIYLFNKYGVKIMTDSHQYLGYANKLRDQFYVERHYMWYVSYTMFIYIIQIFSKSYFTIIFTQYFISYLSMIALYSSAKMLFRGVRIGLLTVFLYVFMIDTLMWNSFILCESLYVSMICFSLWFLLKSFLEEKQVWFYLLTFLIILITSLIKPTGIALFGSTVLCFSYVSLKKVKSIYLRQGIVSGVVVILLLLINRMLETYMVLDNYRLGEVVFRISLYGSESLKEGLMLTSGDPLQFPNKDLPVVAQIGIFIIKNPIYWFKLFSLKLYYFLFHVRPFWSTTHNLFSVFILVPSYMSLCWVMLKVRIDRTIQIFIGSFLLIHILSIGFTSVDWEGRFLIPVLPVVFGVGSAGMVNCLGSVKLLFSKS